MADVEKNDNVNKTETTDVAEKKNDVKAPVKKEKKKFDLRASVGRFIRDYKSELKKVVWYGRKQTIKSTILVVVSIVVSAVVIGALDFGFSRGLMALGSLI